MAKLLTTIITSGLEAFNQTINLSPVTAILGANGKGKTSALRAISLLATGQAQGIDRTPAGVMSLSRGAELHVTGVVTEPDGSRRIESRRSWTRGEDGVVKASAQHGTGKGKTTGKAAEAKITAELGGWSEAWRPEELLDGGVALRDRLVRLLADDEIMRDVVPSSLLGDGDGLMERLDAAVAGAKKRLNEAQALAARLSKAEEDREFTPAPRPGELEAVQEKIAAVRYRDGLLQRLDAARATLGTIGDIPPDRGPELVKAERELSEVRAALKGAEEDLDRMQAEASSLERAKELAAVRCAHCGRSQVSTPEDEAKIATRLAQLDLEIVDQRDLVDDLRDRRDVLDVDVSALREEARTAASALSRQGQARALVDKLEDEAKKVATVGAALDRSDLPKLEAERDALLLAADRAKRRAAEQAELQEATELVVFQKQVLRQLEEAERHVVDRVRALLEDPVSERYGRRVEISIQVERQRVTCRLKVDGVDARTLSAGERWRLIADMLVVLASRSGAAWRPIVLDGIEAVSADARPGLMARLLAAQRAGEVDQVIVAGCPDTWTEIEGVDRIWLGAEARGEAA